MQVVAVEAGHHHRAGKAKIPGKLPHLQGVKGHAGVACGHDHYSGSRCTHRGDGIGYEIGVARRVNQVEFAVRSLEVDHGGCKAVLLFALVREKITQAGSILDGANSFRRAKIMRDSLNKGSFSGIARAEKSDVVDVLG